MSDDWTECREEVTYQEARTVIDHQIDTLSDIDDKALRTVRLTVVLVGVLATAIELNVVQNLDDTLLVVGGGMLFLSMLIGMTTYGESDLYLGPNKSYINTLADSDFDDETWDEDLLTTMGEWIEDNYNEISWNARLLTYTQAALLTGLLFVSGATVFYSVPHNIYTMTSDERKEAAEKGQRSGKGPAWLSKLLGRRPKYDE